jgi:hypothetical protein
MGREEFRNRLKQMDNLLYPGPRSQALNAGLNRSECSGPKFATARRREYGCIMVTVGKKA